MSDMPTSYLVEKGRAIGATVERLALTPVIDSRHQDVLWMRELAVAIIGEVDSWT